MKNNSKSNTLRGALLAGTVISGLVFAAPAMAQDAAKGDVVVVTGSRIASPNLTSVAPITTITPAAIKNTGTTRVEDLLNNMPQVFATQASTISNGASGTAEVDLRGIGAKRTLVLVNGRRLLPGDPFSSAADLNAIPASLIKRVDILTGGASTTYGADAVSGVVNFLLDTEFTGIKLDAQVSGYQHNNNEDFIPSLARLRTAAGAKGFEYPTNNAVDGNTFDATLTMGAGTDDGKGHVTGYVGYRSVNAVTQNKRDYSACTLQNVPGSASNMRCGGSGTSAEGNFLDSTSNPYHLSSAGTFSPGMTRYNFAPTNYFQRPDKRFTAGMFGHYDINEAFKPYAEFMFMNDRSVAQIAPSGDFGNTLTINCDNPLLSSQQKGIFCRNENLVTGYLGNFPLTGITNPNTAATPIDFYDSLTGNVYNKAYMQILRRNVEGGARQDDLEHTQFRQVLGAKGKLDSAWTYDTYFQYGKTNYSETYKNDLSVRKLQNALDVVQTANGPQCRVYAEATDMNCVPWDIFTGAGPSAAAMNYVSSYGFQRGINTETIAEVSLTGDLGTYGVKSPYAVDGVSVNVGLGYRKETLDLKVDDAFATGDLTGQGGATLPVRGSFFVKEGVIEATIPVIQDKMVKELSFNTAYRRSDYTISNGNDFITNTYKFGGALVVNDAIRFRASFNHAVRAPNINELFSVQHVSLDGSTDPCSGETPSASLAACALTGVTAAQYGNISANPSAQYNGLQGGNPDLQPETADTKTVGVVWRPTFLPRASLSVDYYDIKVKDAIQQFGADSILTACVNQTLAASECSSLIHRNPVTGSLWLDTSGYVVDIYHNIGGVTTKGVDVSAMYSLPVDQWGKFNFNLSGTYLNKLVTDNGLLKPYDCVGYYGVTCGTPVAKWRHTLTVDWVTPKNIDVSLRWRYFGSTKVDYLSSNPSLHNANYSLFNDKIDAYNYFDLSATYDMNSKTTFRVGVNNIFDKNPPLISSGASDGSIASSCASTYCNGNTYPAVYDALGRYIFAGVSIKY